MKTKISRFPALGLAVVAVLAIPNAQPTTASAQTTAVTYQGRLNDGANPASGKYDFRFAVYDATNSGNIVVGPITNAAVAVTNGLFTTLMDFGTGPVSAQAIWLDLAVRTNGGAGDFTPLTPRTPVTPVPLAYFANTASNLSGTLPASQLGGTLPLAQLPGAVVTNNAANATLAGTFTGNGAGMANVNAAAVNGLNATNFWQTGGNAGTAAGANFIGTTDNQPLEMWANGARALRLEPISNSPFYSNIVNVIGGSSANAVMPGVVGATISGGGGAFYVTASNRTNSVTADFGTIGGGVGNSVGGAYSGIGGGNKNSIQAGPPMPPSAAACSTLSRPMPPLRPSGAVMRMPSRPTQLMPPLRVAGSIPS